MIVIRHQKISCGKIREMIIQRHLVRLPVSAKSWRWYKWYGIVNKQLSPSLLSGTTTYSRCHNTSIEYDFVKERNRWQKLLANDDSIIVQTGYIILTNTLQWNDLVESIRFFSEEGSALADWLEDQNGFAILPPIKSELRALLQRDWRINFSSKKLILIKVEDDGSCNDKEGSQYLLPKPNGLARLAKYISNNNGEVFKVLQNPEDSSSELEEKVLSYLLEAYEFNRYKTNTDKKAATKDRSRVMFPDSAQRNVTLALSRSTYFIRDLISTPAMDLTPETLQRVTEKWADNHNGLTVETVIGKELLSYNGSLQDGYGCGMIYAVGAAAKRPAHEPRLIRISYRPDKATKLIALVGKGVTYDTGGLNLKPGSSMLNMKKDMGGAAHVLGLLSCLVEMEAPVAIDAWLPTVENVMDGLSFRPGDVLTSVTGLTTEIGNTDAEGRLILGDALALASAEHPDLVIDFATLTGAARVAMGTSVVPFFSNRSKVSGDLMDAAVMERDPMWQLPLWQGYEDRITKSSKVADLSNVASDGLGGAITAALYLKQFVGKNKGREEEAEQLSWVHVDVCAMEGTSGIGEAQGLRAMFRFIWDKYC